MGYVDCEYHLMGVEDQLWARFHSVCIDCDGPVALDQADLTTLGGMAFDPGDYGQELFARLFPPGSDLLLGFRETKVFLSAKGEGMRFRVYIAPNVLNGLRELAWERLHDGDGVMALSPAVAFSRYLAVRKPLGAALAGRPRLLVAIAAPPNLPDLRLAPIDLERTRGILEKCLQEHLEGRIDYEIFTGCVTPGDLLQRLREGGFHALHLVAHGLPPRHGGAGLVLQHANGQANPVSEQGVANIFLGNPDLRLATLVACHGGAAAGHDPFHGLAGRLVRLGVPAVVAMSREISLAAAELFSQHFYRSLAATEEVDVAVNAARQQLSLATDEWDVPVLFMRLRDGRLWKAPKRKPWFVILVAVILCLVALAVAWNGELSPRRDEPATSAPSRSLVMPEDFEERLASARAYSKAGGRGNLGTSVQIYQELVADLPPKAYAALDPDLLALAEKQLQQGAASQAALSFERLLSGLEGSRPETNSHKPED